MTNPYGLWKCGDCRKQFTVTVGTIFEGTHIPLNKWVVAVYIMGVSKKGVSALQLQRMLQRLPTSRLGSCAIGYAML